eukprot:2095247-Lingulodinium_polyedra.AAC.1
MHVELTEVPDRRAAGCAVASPRAAHGALADIAREDSAWRHSLLGPAIHHRLHALELAPVDHPLGCALEWAQRSLLARLPERLNGGDRI